MIVQSQELGIDPGWYVAEANEMKDGLADAFTAALSEAEESLGRALQLQPCDRGLNSGSNSREGESEEVEFWSIADDDASAAPANAPHTGVANKRLPGKLARGIPRWRDPTPTALRIGRFGRIRVRSVLSRLRQ
jgi:hypothetical protein